MSKRKSFPARNLPKYIMQWTALAAILFFLTGLAGLVFPEMEKADPEAYCPMGGLQAFCTYLVRGSLPCSMTTMQIVMGLALAATVIFLGKLFCSYLCPIGTVEDLLTEARRALRIKKQTSHAKLSGALCKVLYYHLFHQNERLSIIK